MRTGTGVGMPQRGAVGAEERIRAAAVRLWSERGFHGVGIRELAEEAGLSSASLYHYMGTKEDLLADVMSRGLRRLVLAAERVTQQRAGAGPRMNALVQLHVLTHALRPRETRVVDGELRALSGDRRGGVMSLRDEYESYWRTTIDEGRASGAFRVEAPGMARLALLEMCTGVARWYDPGGPMALSEVALGHAQLASRVLGAEELELVDEVDWCRGLVGEIWSGPGGG
ncbi:TetR/AcrR family transcriptional regulator [Actinoalloteichus caeruleus]|uniref:TetR/AcrR family transcriptional regulator n=1 Tax=Actinoalloteichus cyanogriseus TaxID=2893586 RepID=UPI000A56AF85|nr:TetR/AcrR family transcriptional regulator [Actinoalloteichus caeruleus]